MSQKIDAALVCKFEAFSIVSVPSADVSNAYKAKNVKNARANCIVSSDLCTINLWKWHSVY